MNKIIEQRPVTISPELAGTDLAPLLQRIYAARGIESGAQLDCSLRVLHPYHQLRDIDRAVHEIAGAVTRGERILVIGDFDCDGATSSALAVLALREMGAAWVDFLVPDRFRFGYGLSPEIVAEALKREPSLLITVDNGISSVAGVAAAIAAGLRVVVTDHHLPGAELPAAQALVNPNQRDCAFPGKNTCGVGVIFYVMSALRRALAEQDWFEQQGLALPNLAKYLDLVALGTVADVVSLDANNRILVHQGLQRVRAGQARPGILALLEVAGRKRQSLVASDLGFAVAPRLNAAGRLEDMSIGINCLLSADPDEARRLAQQLDRLNEERKGIEQTMQEQALHWLSRFTPDADMALPFGLCLYDEEWHEGVIGILASRIKERLNRPVIAFANAEGDTVKGSARSIPGVHIRDVLDAVAAANPGLLTNFGGHAMAAGMTLPRSLFERFSQAFDLEVRRQLSEEDLVARIETDGELRAAEMTLEMAQVLRNAGPWGQHFPEPLFDGCFDVLQQRIVGQRHLKLVLADPASGISFDAIAFNVDLALWPNEAARARVVYKLDINEFRGQTNVQLLVDYLEPL